MAAAAAIRSGEQFLRKKWRQPARGAAVGAELAAHAGSDIRTAGDKSAGNPRTAQRRELHCC